jgi:hypothetical protein
VGTKFYFGLFYIAVLINGFFSLRGGERCRLSGGQHKSGDDDLFVCLFVPLPRPGEVDTCSQGQDPRASNGVRLFDLI